MFLFLFLCSMYAAIGIPLGVFAASVDDVIFTEIMYDFSGGDDRHEWVELHNTTGSAVDVTDWRFNDGSNHILNVPPKNGGQGSLIVSAGGYIVLTDDAVIFLSDHPGYSGTVIDTVMSLNNTAETLKLIDEGGAQIDSVSYVKEWGANGNGKTLEKTGSWREGSVDGGSPGASSSAPIPIPVPPPAPAHVSPPPATPASPPPAPQPMPAPTSQPQVPPSAPEPAPAPTPVPAPVQPPVPILEQASVPASEPTVIQNVQEVPSLPPLAPMAPISPKKIKQQPAPSPIPRAEVTPPAPAPLLAATSSMALSVRGFPWNIYLIVLALVVAIFFLLQYAQTRRNALQTQEQEDDYDD